MLATIAVLETEQVSAQEEFFTEAELLHALSWGDEPDAETRRLATWGSGDPAVAASVPEIRELGHSSIIYTQDMLILLSLVSAETNAKVERYLEERRLDGVPWGPVERAAYDARRAQIREGLIKAGKIKDKR